MKTFIILLTFALLGCLAQTNTDGCGSYTDSRECQATDRCLWDKATSCNGTVKEFCRLRSTVCTQAITCARELNSEHFFTFSQGCIPDGWGVVALERCQCDPAADCEIACNSCERCVEGACVSNDALTCGASNVAEEFCPFGYTCETDSCVSKCEPECPRDLPRVDCLIAPCDLPPPEGCNVREAICINDYCGGCNRRYVDAAGNEVCKECSEGDCGVSPPETSLTCREGATSQFTGRCVKDNSGDCRWERRECPPPVCEPVTCRLYCPYGFEVDANGCEICECKERTPCSNTDCSRVVCQDDEYPVIEEGQCCPTCVPRCRRDVECPAIRCAQGYEGVIRPGECCPTCVPTNECGNCPAPPTCSNREELTTDRCGCRVCKPLLNCRDVDCPDVECPRNTKAVVEEGDCCPLCKPINPCTGFECPAVNCLDNEEPVLRDLSCCRVCRPRDPVDRCANVRCARPDCRPEEFITREGECCPQCPLCRDNERRVCTPNDDNTCRLGIFRGDECEEPVPVPERIVREITIRYCSRDDPCVRPDAQTIRTLIARITGVNSAIISVTAVEDDTRACCFIFKVTLTASTSDNIDVDAERDVIVRTLAEGDFDFEIIEESEPSSASLASASLFLAGAATALCL